MGLFDIFKKSESVQPTPSPKPVVSPATSNQPYSRGDVIGNKFEIIDILGKGGCGIVYQVYAKETGDVGALKTFLDKYLTDVAVRERFKKEATVWVNLDKHPYIVTAHFVDEISGRLFIGIEYIEPPDGGWNTLDDYLKYQQVDYVQGLKWAIQFCHGMEHAISKGVKAHRDIKPANIMISNNKTVKISDFGLAGFIDASADIKVSVAQNIQSVNHQTMLNVGMGTPTHMSPEQFINAAGCDERSDIYSFGVVLYQIASGGRLPFYTDNLSQFWQILQYLQSEKEVPRLKSKLDEIIYRCMKKKSDERFQSFLELRKELEFLLKMETGEIVVVPSGSEISATELNSKGFSLNNIGRYEEAIDCLDKAISMNPNIAEVWCNKGLALVNWGKYAEAINTLISALERQIESSGMWCNLGLAYDRIGNKEQAFKAYQRAIEFDPNNYMSFYNIGTCLSKGNQSEKALKYFDKAIDIFNKHAPAWSNKGRTLLNLNRFQDALDCFEIALDINPMSYYGWHNKGICYQGLIKYEESILCFDKAIAINVTIDSFLFKVKSLVQLKQYSAAVESLQQVLDREPTNLVAITGKILCFRQMGQLNDALEFVKTSLLILPSTPSLLYLKAGLEDNLGLKRETINSYIEFLSVTDDDSSEQAKIAHGRIAYLFKEGGV
jgi:serine/threonine protein kinase